MGSSRPGTDRRHLYRQCTFTESFAETVSTWLLHSCGSELHKNQTFYTNRNSKHPFVFTVLCFSYPPYRYGDRTISSSQINLRARRVVSEGSRYYYLVFPADCLHESDCHLISQVQLDTQSFQHLVVLCYALCMDFVYRSLNILAITNQASKFIYLTRNFAL